MRIQITCEHCGRQGEREWTGGGASPAYCSPRCQRRATAKRWRQRRQGRMKGRCRNPEKIYFLPNGAGVRTAAWRAAQRDQYVYPCNCLRFHLTSIPRSEVPPACVDASLPLSERADAWVAWLEPIAAELRQRMADAYPDGAAGERQEQSPQAHSGVPK